MSSMVLLTDSDSDWRSDEEEELLRWEKPPTRRKKGRQSVTSSKNVSATGSSVPDRKRGPTRIDIASQDLVTNTKSIPVMPRAPDRGGDMSGIGRVRRSSSPPRTPPPREPDSLYLHGTLVADLKDEQVMKKRRTWCLYGVLTLSTVSALMCIALPVYIPTLLLLHVESSGDQTTTYACLLGGMAAGSIMTSFTLNILGTRWVLVAASSGTSLFIISRFSSWLPFVAISAVIAGMSFAPGVAALHMRLSSLAADFVQNGGGAYSSALSAFNGLVIGWYQSAPVLAGILCLTLLPSVSRSQTFSSTDVIEPFPDENMTSNSVGPYACGQHYRWSHESFVQNMEAGMAVKDAVTVKYRVQATLGCFLLCSLGAVLLSAVGLKELTLTRQGESQGQTLRQRIRCAHVWSVLTWVTEPKLLLLIPVVIFTGMEQMVGYSVFLRAYTTCFVDGRYSIFVTFLLAGITLPVSAFTGYATRWIGRIKWILLAGVCHFGALVGMTLWGDPGSWAFFIVALFWGIGDALWHGQLPVLFCLLFYGNLEDSFSHFLFWRTIGYIIVFGMTQTAIKTIGILFTAIGVLSVSLTLYVILEIRVRLSENEAKGPEEHYTMLQEDPSWLPAFDPVQPRKERTTALVATRIPGSREDALS